MKRIYNILLASVALLAFVPSFAQTRADSTEPPYKDEGGLCYSKTVSEPNTDGIYTITLESFVTGSVTMKDESVPADIVLVLDLSQSMTQKYPESNSPNSRLYALKNAVSDFLEVIYHNDNYKDKTNDNPRSKPLGNRLSVVTFGGSRNNTGTTRVRSYLTNVTLANGNKNTDIISYITGLNDNNINSNTGTFSDEGMSLANGVITVGATNGITQARKDTSSRTVVLFTDGAPGDYYQWRTGNQTERSYQTANRCIAQSYIIKNQRDATVFTVLLGTIENDDMRHYLEYTSSNYLNAQSLTSSGSLNPAVIDSSTGNVDPDKSFQKLAGSDLSAVFTTIAEASGGSSKDLSEATVSNVDIVSASFTLPPGTLTSDIKLYTAPYLGTTDDSGYLQFGDKIAKGSNTATYRVREKDDNGAVHFVGDPILVDEGLTVELGSTEEGGKTDKIIVNGFDYGNNFCGPDALQPDPGYNGHKVIIEIPIMMDPEAVGGPDVDTNAPGSGIYINGENVVHFESPHVSLPVNIHIRKTGLDEGESAKFTIQRKYVKDSDAPGGTNPWVDVTSVFVTRHAGQASEGENAPITKVVGMPSTDSDDKPYVYKVVEDDWSWSYNSLPLTAVTTDKLETNPFIFQNTKKEDIDYLVRHAESKATNTFNPDKTNVQYDDSKPRATTSAKSK